MTDVTNVAGGGIIKYPLAERRLWSAGESSRAPSTSPAWAAHAFIAPDESYIVFDSDNRPGGQGGEGDLYVVFRNPDGSWSDAFNLGDTINTPGTNFCPMVSPDGKYLFYAASRDIYWVSAEVIHRLRPAVAKKADADKEPRQRRPGETCVLRTDRRPGRGLFRPRAGSTRPSRPSSTPRPGSRRRCTPSSAVSSLYHARPSNSTRSWTTGSWDSPRGCSSRPRASCTSRSFRPSATANSLPPTKSSSMTARRRTPRRNTTSSFPTATTPGKEYPLFIVLHGNNINTAVIKPKWKLDKLAGRFILAFLQSSQVSGSESFIWDDLPAGRRDIAACYAWLQAKYKIDRTRVLIGGFSGGAAMAIDAVLRQVIPAAGFIALCPGGVLPGRADMEIFKEAAGKNIRGSDHRRRKGRPGRGKGTGRPVRRGRAAHRFDRRPRPGAHLPRRPARTPGQRRRSHSKTMSSQMK